MSPKSPLIFLCFISHNFILILMSLKSFVTSRLKAKCYHREPSSEKWKLFMKKWSTLIFQILKISYYELIALLIFEVSWYIEHRWVVVFLALDLFLLFYKHAVPNLIKFVKEKTNSMISNNSDSIVSLFFHEKENNCKFSPDLLTEKKIFRRKLQSINN